MRLLLDTHVFLWHISGDPSLPAAFRAAIQDPANEVYLSVASVWEAVIKYGLGKLPLPSPPEEYLPRQRGLHKITSLPIDEGAFTHLASLPLLHRDPFDRIMLARALQHDLTVATVDNAVRGYPVKLLLPYPGRGPPSPKFSSPNRQPAGLRPRLESDGCRTSPYPPGRRSMLGRVFLGKYEAVSLIGEGGMGRVYLARQRDLERDVVVKVMHDHVAADPQFRERFTREMMVMARFVHPYAVTLFDATLEDPQGPCIVMEYIRGVTLEDQLHQRRRMEPPRAARLLRMLCEVLQAAHGQGIIHRDLKPANLMLVDPGALHEMLKVMDFGLAKIRHGNAPSISVSDAEFAVGTPGYMCPEQARGEAMDGRGDLYSVGVILFELLTGRLPFTGATTMEVLLAHATTEPPSFGRVGAAGIVPPAIEQVVQWCLAKDPAQRPQNARELAEAFESALAAGAAAVSMADTASIRPKRTNGNRPGPTVPGLTPPPTRRPSIAESPVMTETEPRQAALTLLPPAPSYDPRAVVSHLEAWMPEKIATYKLRGFIHDVGGELVESVPGRIRVRLGGKGCVYSLPSRGPLAWIGLGRRANAIDMELRLQRLEQQNNQLRITVFLTPETGDLSADLSWRKLCGVIFVDLRGYLMGQAGDTAM